MKQWLIPALISCLAALTWPVGPAGAQPVSPGTREDVVGLSVRGVHRAYPTALFSARRVVNDMVGGIEVVIFHDPERGLSTAWFRTVLGEPIEFSGAANGVVADDLTTITRWDLVSGVAVGGNLQGQRLVPLIATMTTWTAWAASHANAQLYQERH